MTTGLLLAALLSLPPQPSAQPAPPDANAQEVLPLSSQCGYCAPPRSTGPETGFKLDTKKHMLIAGAIGAVAGWSIPRQAKDTPRFRSPRFQSNKPAIIWGAVGAVTLVNLITHGREEPAPVTVSIHRPAPPTVIDAPVRRLAPNSLGKRYFFDKASYWTLGYLVAQPLGLAFSGSKPSDRIGDGLITLEATAAAGLLVIPVKHLAHRTRPYAYNCEPLNAKELGEPDARFSFYSGHTSLAFAVAASTAHIAKERQWRNAGSLKWTNYGFAIATGAFRILADRHYLTDVLLGAATGMAVGHYLAKWRTKPGRPVTTQTEGVSSMASLSLPVRNGVVTAQFGHGFGFNFSVVK